MSPLSSHSGQSDFATTQWTMVLNAAQADGARALATLCERYWYPLYAYVRRRTGDYAQAQDLTQEFFARLLEKGVLGHAARERGRFRSFLLTAMKNFLANQREKAQALKRGGEKLPLALDFDSGESRYRLEPGHQLTPERIFERQWTLQLLELVLQRLGREFEQAGKARQFEVLREFISGPREGLSYADAAMALQLSEEAARQAASRLRKRYRDILREEVAQTVNDPQEVDDELRSLLASLAD
jgi:RNA polymerase sigma factor (sigma-70 family)